MAMCLHVSPTLSLHPPSHIILTVDKQEFPTREGGTDPKWSPTLGDLKYQYWGLHQMALGSIGKPLISVLASACIPGCPLKTVTTMGPSILPCSFIHCAVWFTSIQITLDKLALQLRAPLSVVT